MEVDARAALRVAKRLQSRFYAADYAEAALIRRWAHEDTDGPYETSVSTVAPSREEVSRVLVYKCAPDVPCAPCHQPTCPA